MTISFSCPNCHSRMTVPDHLAGKKGNCGKCKKPILVPGSDGLNGAPVGSPPGTSSQETKAKPTPPPPKADSSDSVDMEAEAAAALIDAPREESKKSNFIEFACPQCDEPLKVSTDLAGKRHPCPECRRIIQVPVPKIKDPADWRNTGPKLPAGARRDDGPAPEGAWGSSTATRASADALLEAGVIKEKEKPLSLYQKYQTHLLVAVPLVALGLLGLFTWNWMARNQEQRSLSQAIAAAEKPEVAKRLGPEGVTALHGFAGRYYLLSQRANCASQAREQYGKAINLGAAIQTPASDALLGDLAVDQLDLAGGPAETDTNRKLEWREVHKMVRSTLAAINSQTPRVIALPRVAAGLIAQEQTDRIPPLLSSLYPSPGADRSEAYAAVAMELLRQDRKIEAEKLLPEVLEPYEPKAVSPTKKGAAPEKPPIPPIRPGIVTLALMMNREPPKPGKSLEDEENANIGRAEALMLQGKADEARQIASRVPTTGGGRLRALLALASVAKESDKASQDLDGAMEASSSGTGRPDMIWPLFELIQVGLKAGLPREKLQAVADHIADPGLASWCRYLIVQRDLDLSRAVEPVELIAKMPANSLGGLMAHLQLARHNSRLSGSWAKNIHQWDEGSRAMGALGVALGMQGQK